MVESVAQIQETLLSERDRVYELFEKAKRNAPARARSWLGHRFRSLMSHDYRDSHNQLDSRSRELGNIEFRLRATKLYATLLDQAGLLGSRLAETHFSKDLENDLREGIASLSDDLAKAVTLADTTRELTSEERARVADRLAELEGLITETINELDQRVQETDITKWFTGDVQPAASTTADTASEDVTQVAKVQDQLEETKRNLQQTQEDLDTLQGWNTLFGTLWLIGLLDGD